MKKALLLLAFVTLISSPSWAQFHMKLGPTVGMNFNLHTGSDLTETGTGFGFVIGGQLDMSFTPVVGLITNMQFYDNRSASRSSEGSNQYTDNNGNPVRSTVSTDESISLAYFMIEPLLKLNIPSSMFYFVFGPAVGFNIEGSFNTEESETLPPPYTWQETGTDTKKQTTKGSISNLLTRFAIKLGAGFDINVGGFYITPGVNFEYGLTKVRENVEWRILTIQGTATFKFSLM